MVLYINETTVYQRFQKARLHNNQNKTYSITLNYENEKL